MRHGHYEAGGGSDPGLGPRGRDEVARIARWLKAHAPALERVLCSGARRARETLDVLGPIALGARCGRIEVDILGATPEHLRDTLAGHGGAARALLVIGHNPGLHLLACEMAREGDAGLRARLAAGLPTGGLVEIAVEGEGWDLPWSRGGTLAAFVRPADLPHQSVPG